MIATTGELRRLQNLDSFDHTIELFMGIYGVGRTKALKFVMQGCRTLQDILDREEISESQRIGIKLYHVNLPLSNKSVLIAGLSTKDP